MRPWILIAALVAGGCRFPARPTWQPLRPGPHGYPIRPVKEWPPLWAQSWVCAGEPRAIIVLLHGRTGDGADAYAGLGRHLAANGFAVHTYDLRGTGRSGGWTDQASRHELAWFVKHVRRDDRPLFLLAHGIATRDAAMYASAAANRVAGVVMVSPLIGPDADFWDALERLRAPLLLLHGRGDPYVEAWASAKVYAFATVRDKTIRLYEAVGHDLWEDRLVAPLVDLDRWLAAQVDGGPVLASSPIGTAAPPEARPLAQSETFLTVPLGLYLASRSHAGRPWTLSSGWDAGVVLARHLVSELHVFPLGVGRRLGREGVVYAMTGAGVSATGRDVGFELPLFASLELQASAGVRLLGWLRVSRILGDQDRVDPETGGGLAVRFGRNRRHWPGVRWSDRPIVGLILQETGDTLLLGVVYGSHFFSSN